MPDPMEICLEELHRGDAEDRYVRCVAQPGAVPGLALDRTGGVQWMPGDADVHGLRVSADGRLLLVAAAGGGPVTVERGARSLRAPAGQRVILMDQDLLRIDGRSLRVHVHGAAPAVHAPERISTLARVGRAAAAALALGGALGAGASTAGGAPPPIEVRVRPPDVAPPQPPRPPVVCAITSQKTPRRNGPLVIEATCPTSAGLAPGQHGWLLHPKDGSILPDAMVKITAVAGSKVTAEALKLTKPTAARKVRFLPPQY